MSLLWRRMAKVDTLVDTANQTSEVDETMKMNYEISHHVESTIIYYF